MMCVRGSAFLHGVEAKYLFLVRKKIPAFLLAQSIENVYFTEWSISRELLANLLVIACKY